MEQQAELAIVGVSDPNDVAVYAGGARTEAPSDLVCLRCQEPGHFASRCNKSPVPCKVCGKKWHAHTQCRQLQGAGTLGQRPILTRTTGNRMVIEVQDYKSREDLLENLRNHFEIERDRERVAKNKASVRAKAKRKAEKEKNYEDRSKGAQARASTTARGTDPPGVSDDDMTDMSEDEGGPSGVDVRVARISKRGRFAPLVLGGHVVEALADTGADVNCMSKMYFNTLPEHIRADKRKSRIIIEGLGGKQKVVGEVSVPCMIGGFVTLADFCIVDRLPYNILGVPLMEDAGCVVDVRAKKMMVKETGAELDMHERGSAQTKVAALQTAIDEVPDDAWDATMSPDLSFQQREDIHDAVQSFRAIWRKTAIGMCRVEPIEIEADDACAVAMKPSRLTPEMEAEAERQISDLLAAGAVEPSRSAWAANVVMAPKPNGRWRMCGNYTGLNRFTAPDAFPIPEISSVVD